MTPRQPSSVPPALRTVDTVLEVCVLGLLAWLPLAFGGVLPSSHLVVVVVAAGMGVLLGLRTLVWGAPFVWSWAVVPLLAFVLIVFLQGVPLSLSMLSALSPATAATWREMLAEPGGVEVTSGTLSLYPQGTAEDFRLLVAGVVIFLVAVCIYREGARLRRMLGGVAVVGAVVELLGLLQIVFGAPGIYWVEGWGNPNPKAGPFRHYGHFSQFVNLALGCGLGLMLLRLGDRTSRTRFEAYELFQDLGAPARKLDRWIAGFVVLAMVAVALSTSRNGVISLLVGGAVVAAVMQGSKYAKGMGWPLLALVLVAFCTLLFLGFDPVYERLATLGDADDAYSGRLAIVEDTLAMVGQYPVLGTGQGAFEYTFPVFDTSERPGRAEHAENLYIEILAETGMVGALCVLALIGIAVVVWFKKVWRGREPMDGALFGLALGLVAVSFHAFTDFGLRIPAVAALFTVCLGVVCGRGAGMPIVGPWGKGLGGLAVALAGVLVLQVPDLMDATAADGHRRAVEEIEQRLLEVEDAEVLGEFDRLRGHLRAAAELQPGNVEYRLAAPLADWRWEQAHALGLEQAPEEELRPENSPELVEVARRVQQELLDARAVCPTYGLVWSMIGQFGALWLGDQEAEQWIARGLDFAPQNPSVCLAAARYHLRVGEDQAAVANFRRAIRMRAPATDVLETIVYDLRRFDIAREVVRGDARWLVWLERLLENAPNSEVLRAEIRAEARAIMEVRCAEPSPEAWMLGAIGRFAMAENTPEEDKVAERYFVRYLGLKPDDPVRVSLADLMHRQGRVQDAREELRRYLRYKPGNGAATSRLKRWETHIDREDPRLSGENGEGEAGGGPGSGDGGGGAGVGVR